MIGGILLSVLSVIGIGIEYYMYSELERASSQLISLLDAIEYGTDFSTFVSDCWLFIVLGLAFIWICLSVAFPKKKGVA